MGWRVGEVFTNDICLGFSWSDVHGEEVMNIECFMHWLRIVDEWS